VSFCSLSLVHSRRCVRSLLCQSPPRHNRVLLCYADACAIQLCLICVASALDSSLLHTCCCHAVSTVEPLLSCVCVVVLMFL
jgi:hypothetical protein